MERVLKNKKNEYTSIRYFQGLNYWVLIAVFVANIFFQLSEVSSSVFVYVGIVVIIAPLFFLDKDDYIYVFVSLINVIRFSTVFNISVINLITIIYFVRVYILDNEYLREKDKRRLPSSLVIPCVVFILYSLQYLIGGERSIRMSFIAIKLMLFLIYVVDTFRCCTNRPDGLKRFMNIQVYYIAGVSISIICSTLINPSYSLDSTRMSLTEGSGVNQLGISLAVCLIFILLEITKVKNTKEWVVLAASAMPLLYFCFATQSRTCMVVVVLSFFLTFFLGLRQPRARKAVIFMLLGMAAFAFVLATFGEETSLYMKVDETIDRFINPKNDDVSNGRYDLWSLYLRTFTSDAKLFFLGGSLDEYGGTQAHNIFIEIFATYGIIGTGIVIWMYSAVFYEIRKTVLKLGKGKIRVLGFLLFVMVFVMGMTSHTLLDTATTINFCMGVAMIYFYGENDFDEDTLVDSYDGSNRICTERKKYKNLWRMDNRYSQKFRRTRRS